MTQLSFKEILPSLLKDKRILKAVEKDVGCAPEELIRLFAAPNPYADERLNNFYESALEKMEDYELVSSAEIEFFTSYGSTSEFYLCKFGEIYFIENLEHDNIAYFKSAEDAKAAAKKAYGFDWDDPGSFSSDSKVSDLLDSFD